MPGTISHPVVSEVRKKLGLGRIGKSRAKTRRMSSAETVSASKRRGRQPGRQAGATAALAVETTVQATSRTTALLAVEVEIDRLIFQVMRVGDLPEVETALRSARRALYQVLSS